MRSNDIIITGHFLTLCYSNLCVLLFCFIQENKFKCNVMIEYMIDCMSD